MARLDVYLPDALAAEVKRAGLNLSTIIQEAVKQSLLRATDLWLAGLTATPSSNRVSHDRALAALDASRGEPPGTRP